MEIRVLRYFLTVAREGNITKAAELLHITQPTLSRQLASLEEECGTQLFKRVYHRIELTEAGMLLRDRAEEITALADKALEDLLNQEDEISGTVYVGEGLLSASETLAGYMEEFSQLYPKVSFSIVSGSADQISQRIDHGLIDVALLLEPVDKTKYQYITIQNRERWCALVKKSDPLSNQKYVTPQDLEKRRLIIPMRSEMSAELLTWFHKTEEELHIAYRENLSDQGVMLVKNSSAVLISIEGSVMNVDPNSFIRLPLLPEISANSIIAWYRTRVHSNAAQRFIDFIQNK